MNIDEKYRQNRLNKIFLLVFHGGLVCYLFLHNLILPIVQNLGQRNPFFQEIHYWFIPQFILFLAFSLNPIGTKQRTIIPVIIGINFIVFFWGTLEIGLVLKNKITLEIFSASISMGAIAFFFLGFFLHFKKFYSWDHFKLEKEGLLSLLMGSFFFFGQNFIITKKPIQPPSVDEVKIESGYSDEIIIKLPNNDFSKNKNVLINSATYRNKISFFPGNYRISIKNGPLKKHILRLERLHESRWVFDRVIILDKNETKNVKSASKEIYRLRSPSSMEIGIHYIVIGSDLFPKSTYKLVNNKVDIIYE